MRLRNGVRLPLFAGCFFLLWFSSIPLRAQNFNLQTGREPIASLDGLWRFHTGDNPQWASPDFDDSQWLLLRSYESWTKQGYPGYSGYAWYRFKVQVPDGNKPNSLLLTNIMSGYQVYANGKLIGSAGSTALTRNPIVDFVPETFQLPRGSPGTQVVQIALRVWNYKPFTPVFGGGPSAPGNAVGDPVLLARRLHLHREAFALTYVNDYTYCLLAASVGLTILALFLFRTADREYLWFAVLLLAGTTDAVLSDLIVFSSLPFPFIHQLELAAFGLSMIAALMFFSIVLDARRSVWWWVACIAAAASIFTVAPYYFQVTAAGTGHALWLCCLLPAYIWIVVALATGAVGKNASARLLLAPAVLLYGFAIVNNIVRISWELSWQRKLPSLNFLLLHHPFPLYIQNVSDYIFVLALLIFLVRRFALARQEETRLSTEMEAARSVQSFLVPATVPNTPGFQVESIYFPASEVGGDFFQILPGGDGSLLIVVGDVSGKGLKAAMTVSTIVGALRAYPLRAPAEVLANLNRVLHGQVSGFVTCCATLIAADETMAIANAGHLSPYRNGEELTVAGGLPLGILAEGSYEETRYRLAPGDRLTFVSDGVVEATNEKRELFGFERTQAISSQPAASIAETAKHFGQEDDITVVTVTRALEAIYAV